MRTFLTAAFLFYLSSQVMSAQPEKGMFVNGSIGFGYVYPHEDIDVGSSGFYAQGEFVWSPLSWFGVRPYAGVIVSSGEKKQEREVVARVKSNAFLLGTKIRLAAPIPYVAPFVEVGVGMSAGSFETFTPVDNVKESGVFVHVPYALGFAVGRRRNIEIKLTYFQHDSLRQFNGVASVGFTYPLDKS